MHIMALPPTETNLYLHVCSAHLQTMLWKAVDQQGPPTENITTFGWEVTEGIPSPCIATRLHAPQDLIDVINCGCKAEGKADAALRGVVRGVALSTVLVQQSMGATTHSL